MPPIKMFNTTVRFQDGPEIPVKNIRVSDNVTYHEFEEPIQCNADTTFEITFTWEAPMPNEANRRNLKALMDILSDAHAELTQRAATINARLLDADTRNREAPGSGKTSLKFADHQLDRLLDGLLEQGERVLRIEEEIETIKDNLKI